MIEVDGPGLKQTHHLQSLERFPLEIRFFAGQQTVHKMKHALYPHRHSIFAHGCQNPGQRLAVNENMAPFEFAFEYGMAGASCQSFVHPQKHRVDVGNRSLGRTVAGGRSQHVGHHRRKARQFSGCNHKAVMMRHVTVDVVDSGASGHKMGQRMGQQRSQILLHIMQNAVLATRPDDKPPEMIHERGHRRVTKGIAHGKVHRLERIRERIQNRHKHILVREHHGHTGVAYLPAVDACEQFIHLHAGDLGLGGVGRRGGHCDRGRHPVPLRKSHNRSGPSGRGEIPAVAAQIARGFAVALLKHRTRAVPEKFRIVIAILAPVAAQFFEKRTLGGAQRVKAYKHHPAPGQPVHAAPGHTLRSDAERTARHAEPRGLKVVTKSAVQFRKHLPQFHKPILYIARMLLYIEIPPEPLHIVQRRSVAEITLYHLPLLVGKEIGGNLSEILYILEESLRIHIILVHLAEVVQHRLPPGSEAVEIKSTLIGRKIGASSFKSTIYVVKAKQHVDTRIYLASRYAHHEIINGKNFRGKHGPLAESPGETLEKKGARTLVRKNKTEAGEVIVTPDVSLCHGIEKGYSHCHQNLIAKIANINNFSYFCRRKKYQSPPLRL